MILPRGSKLEVARDLAVQLMTEQGLDGWIFRFNRRKRQMGVCFYPNRGRPGRIEMSTYFVASNSDEEIRDTILHEIAHALVGPHHGHDAVWKAKCIELGAAPKRCGHAYMPVGRWRALCPSCQRSFDRHRRPRRMKGVYCRACGPERGSITWIEAERG